MRLGPPRSSTNIRVGLCPDSLKLIVYQDFRNGSGDSMPNTTNQLATLGRARSLISRQSVSVAEQQDH